ncbi:hypothetical protein RsS62_17120 [Rhizobium dioscoreae]|nr:hypothetical protein RsS62_17120 [Rhizobium dioscoreae]
MIVTVKTGDRGIVLIRSAAVIGVIKSMPGGAMIMFAVIVVMIMPRMVVAIGRVRMMIVPAAAGMVALFGLWCGDIALRQRENFVAQSRDPLCDVGQQVRIALMLDRHDTCGDRDGNILDTLQPANGRVDFRSA